MKTVGTKGRLFGGMLLVAGVIAVFVVKRDRELPEHPPVIRPLKTIVIGESYEADGERYPGNVEASRQVTMAFEVKGTLQQLLVNEGDEVEEGALLAKLDDRDYVNNLDSAKAELKRAGAQLERVKKAAQSGAVSQQDLTNAQAAFDAAQAEANIKQKALDDTVLKASFSGLIAKTFVKNFESVDVRQEILSLQDVTNVEIKTSIPEARVAMMDPRKKGEHKQDAKLTASFDFFPGRTFDLTVKEFSTEADPVTQTYTATFVMPAPEDVTILPGMSAMVNVYLPASTEAGKGAVRVPLDAVPVDGVGQYFVWLLEPDEGNVYKLTRCNVSVGELSGDNITITSGLQEGDRIAAAGVHVVVEGQKVRLLESDG